MNMINALRRFTSRIEQRVMQTVVKGVVTRVKDSTDLQVVQVKTFAGSVVDGAERVQNYGLTSRPGVETQAVCCAVAGDPGHMVIVAIDDGKNRPKLDSEYDVAMYRKGGTIIKIVDGGHIEIETQENANLTINTAKATVNADSVELGGSTNLKKLITEDILTTLSTHTHPGVMAGGSSTGPSAAVFSVALHATANTQAK